MTGDNSYLAGNIDLKNYIFHDRLSKKDLTALLVFTETGLHIRMVLARVPENIGLVRK